MTEKMKSKVMAQFKKLKENGLPEEIIRLYEEGKISVNLKSKDGNLFSELSENPEFRKSVERAEKMYGVHVFYCEYEVSTQTLTMKCVEQEGEESSPSDCYKAA